MTALGVLALVATIFTGLYPRVMVSQPGFANSLTVSNAASGHYALVVITVVAAIFTPARAALPGLDVPRLSRARGRPPGGHAAGRPCRPPRRRLVGRLARCAPSTLACWSGRGPRGRCWRSMWRSALATVVPVLVQATLLARIVARAFDGASLRRARAGRSSLLALAFAARGGARLGDGGGRPARRVRACSPSCGWRCRAAAAGTSRWRRTASRAARSPRRRCRASTALEAYFARYLPQVVLAVGGPAGRGRLGGHVDLESALIMLLTLPLVPVFMWLIGRYTEQRTRERWQALRAALDALPRRGARAADAARVQPRRGPGGGRSASVSERYRRATMGTLRVSFLSGAVLELAATLGVALVAVTVGRAAGRRRSRAAGRADRARAGPRAVPAASAGSAPSTTPAPTGWPWPSGCSSCSTRPPAADAAADARLAPSPRARRCASRRCRSPIRRGPGRARRARPGAAPGETVALVGESGAGKSTRRRAAAAAARADRRAG